MTGTTATARRPRRVLIVEDHPVLRGVVRMACEASPHLQVAAEVSTGEAALEAVRSLQPEAMVLDLLLPDADGLDVVRRARAERPGLHVLVLANKADDHTVFAAIRAGVDGCLEKTAGVRQLGEAIEMVAAGRRVFTQAQDRAAIAELGRMARHARAASEVAASVTPRELEILRYVSHGYTMRQVASRIGVSPRTVEAHIAKIYRKLGVTNRVRAIGRAAELGLIDLEG